MKLTPENLYEIFDTPEYSNLPKQLAIANTMETDRWTGMVDETLNAGVKTIVWQHCHMLANLFDVYPIGCVSIEFEPGQTKKSVVLAAEVYIDNELCSPDGPRENEHIFEIAANIDQQNMLYEVLDYIQRVDLDLLISRIGHLRDHLGSIKSSREARDRAAMVFPEMESFAKSWLLMKGAANFLENKDPQCKAPNPKL